jgi:hypothetical protein
MLFLYIGGFGIIETIHPGFEFLIHLPDSIVYGTPILVNIYNDQRIGLGLDLDTSTA